MMAPDGDTPPSGDGPLALDTLQRDVLIPQIQAFIDAAADPDARAAYAALKDVVGAGEVPVAMQARLGAVVDVVLSSGRARKLYGPGAELSLRSLFQKTPRGREIAASIRELNTALARLSGDTVEDISAAVRGPGAYAITLKTSGCQLVVRFDRDGVIVESFEVAMA